MCEPWLELNSYSATNNFQQKTISNFAVFFCFFFVFFWGGGGGGGGVGVALLFSKIANKA